MIKKYSIILIIAVCAFVAGSIATLGVSAASSLAQKLAGRILLQVESKGEAWYIDPISYERYYLGRAQNCFDIMRTKGLGITNSNLSQITVAADSKIPGYTFDWDTSSHVADVEFKYPSNLVPVGTSIACPTNETGEASIMLDRGTNRSTSQFFSRIAVCKVYGNQSLTTDVDTAYQVSESNNILVTVKTYTPTSSSIHSITDKVTVYEAVTPAINGMYSYKFRMSYSEGDDATFGISGKQMFEEILASVVFK